MNKTDAIARKIFGWKLNSWDKWYDYELGIFIHESEFKPEENLHHALQIVDRLEQLGFNYSTDGKSEVRFNDVRATGDTLAQAITNAAYAIIEKNAAEYNYIVGHQLC